MKQIERRLRDLELTQEAIVKADEFYIQRIIGSDRTPIASFRVYPDGRHELFERRARGEWGPDAKMESVNATDQ